MKTKIILVAGILFIPLISMAKSQRTVANAGPHHCIEDAKATALQVLKLHTGGDDRVSLDGKVSEVEPVKALRGKGKLDVLELWGSVYKSSYRIRVLYAQIKDSCASMGFEILEAADPY